MPLQPPPGIRLHRDRDDPKKGRSLRATRPFPAGSTIAVFSAPILALPDGAAMRTTCNYCLRPSPPQQTQHQTHPQGQPQGQQQQPQPLRACTACRAAVYCGPACQRAHWRAVHRAECKMFARVRESAGKEWLPTPVRAVAQVMLRLKAGDEEVREAFWDGGAGGGDDDNDGWGGLEGNVEGFRALKEVWADFELQATAAVVYAGLLQGEQVLTKAREVLCKIQTNAFNRLDADTGMTGIFLDPALAMVNHSCVPNAFIGFDKRTAVLRAERDIHDGDEITISYIDNTLPRAARYEALRLYHFQCDCPRCKEDLDVYEVCQASPTVPLNTFSLQPDLHKLRNPPIDRSKVSKAQIEAIYKAWQSSPKPEGDDDDEHLKVNRARWELCKPLIEAGMWAVEPVPTVILDVALRWQTSYKMVVYALPLFCFLCTECEPFKQVAPFMPWRIKGIVSVVKLLAVTGELTASGALASRCTHEGLVGILALADQVTMCEGLLRLAVHHGSIGASDDWEVLQQAKSMLEDVESLQGRETQSELTRAWARDPEDPATSAFFENEVLKPIKGLASFAPEILEANLGGKTLAKK